MKIVNYSFLLFLFIVMGCDQKSQVRHYTEAAIEAPEVSAPIVQDPHAGLDMSTAMGDQTDPHAGLDMSGIGQGQDPHAGLDMSAAPMMPTANAEMKNKLSWVVPQGWIEEPGKGMRLATFHTANPQEINVSIISLGGMAGGVESNLKRWLGQINIQIPDDQLKEFVQSSKDNIFDFKQLQTGASPSTKSMIAAMINSDDATVFVKMTGSIKDIKQNKEKFLKLVHSITQR